MRKQLKSDVPTIMSDQLHSLPKRKLKEVKKQSDIIDKYFVYGCKPNEIAKQFKVSP